MRSRFQVLSGLAALAIVFSACSSTATSPGPTAVDTTAPTAAPSSDAVASTEPTVAPSIDTTPVAIKVWDYYGDTTPIKQGKLSPGAHIPVRPYADFAARYPEYALLFAWNHAGEILAKEQAFKQAGGKFIVYVPRVGELA